MSDVGFHDLFLAFLLEYSHFSPITCWFQLVCHLLLCFLGGVGNEMLCRFVGIDAFDLLVFEFRVQGVLVGKPSG